MTYINRLFSIIIFLRYLFLGTLSFIFQQSQTQQNNTLFFMHSLPEANFLNPAVQIKCRFFVGLPVISSIHANMASSGFNYRQAIAKDSLGENHMDLTFKPEDLPRQNYFFTEAHITLLAIGFQHYDYYYSFTITEKNNLAILYTRDLATFYQQDISPFEGQWMELQATGLFFNHIREYALGISKVFSDKLILGMKAKLLFGKLNIESGNSHINMYTQVNSNDILFDIDGGFNSSIPNSMYLDALGRYRFYNRYDAPVMNYILNRQNPGIAFDFGFIYNYDNHLSFSGSFLDLGMIFYRSNLTNYSLQGNYFYEGEWGSYPADENYLWEVFDSLNNNLTVELNYNSYSYFLDPRIYIGASYKINNLYSINLLSYNRFFPNHMQTGATISMLAKPFKSLSASTSWSYMNKSLTNLGIGFVFGNYPLQVYFVSDNIIGVISPKTAKNINLRFGMNLILGCRDKMLNKPGCTWLKKSMLRRIRKEELNISK